MAESLTGKQIHLRFSWPCAKARLLRRLINRWEFKLLKLLVTSHEQPEEFLLKKAFPDDTESLRKFAEKRGKDMWSAETVTEFWHNYKRNCGACAVNLFTVTEIRGKKISVGAFSVKNPYRLSVKKGDQIYVHCFMAIEKAEIEKVTEECGCQSAA